MTTPLQATVFKNARIAVPSGSADSFVEGDLLVEGHRIGRVGGVIERPGAGEIDARGQMLIPGVIDPHVHFREPGLVHKESIASGSAAAVLGGVTSFLEMPNTKPPAVDQARIDEKLAIAQRTSYANYGFYIAAALDNLDELRSADRVAGIKIFVGSSTGNLLVDDQDVLERIFAETSLPIAVHAEEESMVRANAERLRDQSDPAIHSRIRTPEAAARSVRRVCDLALRHRHRLHILHVSTRAELDAMAFELEANAARTGGAAVDLVSAEVCIPHLFLDTKAYERLGTFAKVNPALRTQADREACWVALKAGGFANVATDHAPHTPDEKSLPYWQAPSGIPSIENSLPLMLNAVSGGLIGLGDVVRWMCEGPARVWSMAGKGAIAEGHDADLVLVDLQRERTIRGAEQATRAGWSPWDGLSLRGWPTLTMVMGRVAMRDGEVVGPPAGRAIGFAPA